MGSGNLADFFSWFEVIYGPKDQPSGTVQEIAGAGADINKGFNGDYVWLKVHTAQQTSQIVDNIWTLVQGDQITTQNDLAKGAGGDYRYLEWTNNLGSRRFITDVALWRTSDAQHGPPSGWDGKTDDINKGRGGSYLYLVWHAEEYTGPK
ncbi:hypothetical protein MBLNU459_g8304t1 [Dothideomycetes sp. NU459]